MYVGDSPAMSVLGYEPTSSRLNLRSALPPKADVSGASADFRS